MRPSQAVSTASLDYGLLASGCHPSAVSLPSRSKKRSVPFGRLVFFIPLVIVLLLVLFAFVSGSTSTAGTLIVSAQSSDNAATPLRVTAVVQSTTSTTPFNLSLRQGTYIVNFGALAWYSAPPARTVVVPAGRAAYAVGVYQPVERIVAISGGSFNQSAVTALHGVTPVVWVNKEGVPLLLNIQGVKPVSLQAGQNFSYIFQSAGKYTFSVYAFAVQGQVTVV